MEKEKKVLNDQVTILKQELKVLGKRSAALEPDEAAKIKEAVHREIKRRRKRSSGLAGPVSLTERRAFDKAVASKIIKDHSNMLVSWSHFLSSALNDKQPN